MMPDSDTVIKRFVKAHKGLANMNEGGCRIL